MRIDEKAMLTEDNYGIEYLLKSVMDCYHEAIREGIKANSIVINKNMVKVPGMVGVWPTMICGLNCYVTADDLPDGYSFAVVEDENKPKTNADRIRAMTDEELEAFLINVDLDKAGSPFINEWGKWLKQPAEGCIYE